MLLAGGAALWLFYFLLRALYPPGMGFGDVKLAGVLGMYLGFLGWPHVFAGTLAAFVLGGLWSLGLLAVAARHPEVEHPVRAVHAGRHGWPPCVLIAGRLGMATPVHLKLRETIGHDMLWIPASAASCSTTPAGSCSASVPTTGAGA